MSKREVDAWFAKFDHPLKDAMQRVRQVIMAADKRMGECIKWSAPTFTFEGNLASFNPRTKKHVSLMFHSGAQIPGKHPRLQGGGDTARYMTFADKAEVESSRKDLQSVVRAWCKLKTAKPARSTTKKRPARKKSAPRKLARKKTARRS
jgi:hypothetical protein